MRQLRGKRAVVTGAGSGIGRAIAIALAREGVHLFLIDIDPSGLAETVQEIRPWNVEVIGRPVDVSRPDEVTEAVDAILSEWGGIDILVNNAGITYYGRTDRMPPEHWERLISVNLLSHIQFTRELLPSLLSRREGHVLNVCSVLGLVGMPKVTAYSTTKFALVGFGESLRHEYGRVGLGVTSLCPGFVRTNLFANAPVERGERPQKLPPGAICTTPEKVARAAVRAIRKNRRIVVVEPLAKILYFTKRFVPSLLELVFHFGRRKRTERKLAQLASGKLSYGRPRSDGEPLKRQAA